MSVLPQQKFWPYVTQRFPTAWPSKAHLCIKDMGSPRKFKVRKQQRSHRLSSLVFQQHWAFHLGKTKLANLAAWWGAAQRQRYKNIKCSGGLRLRADGSHGESRCVGVLAQSRIFLSGYISCFPQKLHTFSPFRLSRPWFRCREKTVGPPLSLNEPLNLLLTWKAQCHLSWHISWWSRIRKHVAPKSRYSNWFSKQIHRSVTWVANIEWLFLLLTIAGTLINNINALTSQQQADNSMLNSSCLVNA